MNAFIHNDPGVEKELRESLQTITGMVVKYDYAIPWLKELKKKGLASAFVSMFKKNNATRI